MLSSSYVPIATMDERTIVAAIDFGTCNTRMAFARKPLLDDRSGSRDLNIYPVDLWEHVESRDVTAPTNILFGPAGDICYGCHAEELYRDLSEADRTRYLFFQNFKLVLHKKEVSKCLQFQNHYNDNSEEYEQSINLMCLLSFSHSVKMTKSSQKMVEISQP